MGCSSSITQAVAQKIRSNTKPKKTDGDMGFVVSNGIVDTETVEDQMRLPVQPALPESLGPRPEASQAPAPCKALQNVGVETEQAAGGAEPTLRSDLAQPAEGAASPVRGMAASAMEPPRPGGESLSAEGVSAREAAVRDDVEAVPPVKVPGPLGGVATVPLSAASSDPGEELTLCGALMDTTPVEAAFEEAASSPERMPALDPAIAVGSTSAPEPTPAPGPALRAPTAAAQTLAKPSLVPDLTPSVEPTPAPEAVESATASEDVERTPSLEPVQVEAAGAGLQAAQEHATSTAVQALKASGGSVLESTALQSEIEKTKTVVAVTGADMAVRSEAAHIFDTVGKESPAEWDIPQDQTQIAA